MMGAAAYGSRHNYKINTKIIKDKFTIEPHGSTTFYQHVTPKINTTQTGLILLDDRGQNL